MIVLSLAAALLAPAPESVATERSRMVAAIRQDVRRASPDADDAELKRVLAVIATLPREEFVAPADRARAYQQTPLPIGHDQTISDPYIVAIMTAAARVPAHGAALDVGTGSGYQAAVLARLTDRVSSIEIVPELAATAKARLARLGFANVDVRAGDGYAGWPDHAPFDAIIVAAGGPAVPQPLLDQLKVGGRLVMPVGSNWANEQILVVTRTGAATTTRCSLGWSMFVPLTGAGGRPEDRPGLRDRSIPLCYRGEVARVDFGPASAPLPR